MSGYTIDPGFLSFIVYLFTAIVLLAAFMFVYSFTTPYNEFRAVRDNNIAAAVAFSGAILGFIFPLMAAIFYTHSILEMAKWAAITGVVQMLLFQVLHRINGCGHCIRERKVAPAILLASMSVAVGMLNAMCISY
jgi:putative membrane protein